MFTDRASGKDARRPELERLLAFVREGDTVVVHRMDRLARNLDDLRRLVQGLGEIRDRSFEAQRPRASGLNLVTAAIVLWNTAYLERAVRALLRHD